MTRNFLKTLALAGLFLCPALPIPNAGAQGSGTPTTTGGIAPVIIITPPVIPPIIFVEFYGGKLTQTSATGGVTTSTFTLNLESTGAIFATLTLDGVSTDFRGSVAHRSNGELARFGVGYLVAVDAQGVRIAGSEKIPLYIKGTFVTGGTTDAAGNSFSFRGQMLDSTGSVVP